MRDGELIFYRNGGWSRAWTEVALGVALGALRALQDRHLRCGWSVLYPDGPEVAVTGILAAATSTVPDADD